MKTLSAFGLAVVLAVASQGRAADDFDKKIVGSWVVEKTEAPLPVGAVAEFTKDGKLILTVKGKDKDIKIEGTYKVEKDKLLTKLTVGDKTHEDTDTITKLTDEALELTDKDKKVTALKKKK